jgi:hypothetical protein
LDLLFLPTGVKIANEPDKNSGRSGCGVAYVATTWRQCVGEADGLLSILATERGKAAADGADTEFTFAGWWSARTCCRRNDGADQPVVGRVEPAGASPLVVVSDAAILAAIVRAECVMRYARNIAHFHLGGAMLLI